MNRPPQNRRYRMVFGTVFFFVGMVCSVRSPNNLPAICEWESRGRVIMHLVRRAKGSDPLPKLSFIGLFQLQRRRRLRHSSSLGEDVLLVQLFVGHYTSFSVEISQIACRFPKRRWQR